MLNKKEEFNKGRVNQIPYSQVGSYCMCSMLNQQPWVTGVKINVAN